MFPVGIPFSQNVRGRFPNRTAEKSFRCQEEELRADELRAAGLLSTGEDVSPEELPIGEEFVGEMEMFF